MLPSVLANPVPAESIIPVGENTQLVLDDSSYTPDSSVSFRIVPEILAGHNFRLSVLRVGRDIPVFERLIEHSELPQDANTYILGWRIPPDAVTGRYALVLDALDRETGTSVWRSKPVTFALWRRDVEIERFDATRRFYFPGDPISFKITVANKTCHPWRNLRFEIGESQYPWISPPRGSSSPLILNPARPVDLDPGESRTVLVYGAIRPSATQGSIYYTASVIEPETSQIVAFRATPAIYLRAAGEPSEPTYPFAYLHSNLSQVRVDDYRSFYRDEDKRFVLSGNRTSFPAGKSSRIWIRLDQSAPDEKALLELRHSSGTLLERRDVEIAGSVIETFLQFPSPGLYELTVSRYDVEGDWPVIANAELAANDLPRALAVICAHPDDEFLHPGVIRAAVENAIPVHLIFLTNGDAGGSERFFGPGFTPAEAIEFGHIRMEEAKAAARHLGVPEANLHFLGLPDGFVEVIRTGAMFSKAVFSPLLGTDHAPYRGVHRSNLPYQRRAVLEVLTELLAKIDPDAVYTSHPDERHADHRGVSLFTIEALRALVEAGRLSSVPSIRTDEFYGAGEESENFSYRDHEFYSSGEAMARVQESYWYYQTQGGNHARGHLLSYRELPRVERHKEILDWRR
jgi:LmbE family N-acetylglucosaminyl deacetylase